MDRIQDRAELADLAARRRVARAGDERERVILARRRVAGGLWERGGGGGAGEGWGGALVGV